MIFIFFQEGLDKMILEFPSNTVFYSMPLWKLKNCKEDKAHNSSDPFSKLYYSEIYIIFISY